LIKFDTTIIINYSIINSYFEFLNSNIYIYIYILIIEIYAKLFIFTQTIILSTLITFLVYYILIHQG